MSPGNEVTVAEVVLSRVDVAGLEHFRLVEGTSGPMLRGAVVVVEDGMPMRLEYEVLCSPSWETQAVTGRFVSPKNDVLLKLRAENGRWWRDDEEIASLSGLIDVDLSLTPATNLLAVRRLDLLNAATGKEIETTAAYVLFPQIELKRLPQRYTRIAERRFHYENLEDGYTTEIEVDEFGLVTSYTGLWTRIWPQVRARELSR